MSRFTDADLPDLWGDRVATVASIEDIRALAPDVTAVRAPNVGDRELDALSSARPALRKLDLAGGKLITDRGLAAVSRLAQLEMLDLTACERITDAGLASTSRLSALCDLNLSFCDQLTDSGIIEVAKAPGLLRLNLNWCHQITDAGLAALASQPTMRALFLWGLGYVTDQGLANLSRLATLRILELPEFAKLTDRGIDVLCRGLTALESLRLANLGVGNDAVRSIATCQMLERLRFNGCDNIDDRGVSALGRLSHLTLVRFEKCPRVSESAVRTLKQRLPHCTIEWNGRDW